MAYAKMLGTSANRGSLQTSNLSAYVRLYWNRMRILYSITQCFAVEAKLDGNHMMGVASPSIVFSLVNRTGIANRRGGMKK
jgi:hypothetical protein